MARALSKIRAMPILLEFLQILFSAALCSLHSDADIFIFLVSSFLTGKTLLVNAIQLIGVKSLPEKKYDSADFVNFFWQNHLLLHLQCHSAKLHLKSKKLLSGSQPFRKQGVGLNC